MKKVRTATYEKISESLCKMIKIENFKYNQNLVDSENNNTHKINISFIGKPNSGKSSLVNTILGNKRLVTGLKAGLTRDSIEIPFSYRNNFFIT